MSPMRCSTSCVECQNLKADEDFMVETRQAGVVDSLSFNTPLKAHLLLGHFAGAHALIEEMKKEGL